MDVALSGIGVVDVSYAAVVDFRWCTRGVARHSTAVFGGPPDRTTSRARVHSLLLAGFSLLWFTSVDLFAREGQEHRRDRATNRLEPDMDDDATPELTIAAAVAFLSKSSLQE